MRNKVMRGSNLFLLFILTLIFIFFSQALWATQFHKDNVVTETLFSHTKPQCIGRYLIDVPESFENQLRNMIFIDDFKIESRPQYLPAFKQMLTRRQEALKIEGERPDNTADSFPFIKEIIPLDNANGVIIDHNISGEDDFERILETYVNINGVTFFISTKILDLTAQKYAERKAKYLKAGFSELQVNEKPTKLLALRLLISRLSGRKDNDIPIGNGICIPHGFIADDGKVHEEKISFSYKNDDFIFNLFTDNTEKGSSDTLFSRSADIEEALALYGYKHSISKKAFSPGGIPVQQWLFGGKRSVNREMEARKEQVPVYDFKLYANEEIATPQKPWLSMGLNSEYQNTRYSEAEMIAIWDRLVGSLRYRPGAF